MKKLVFNTIAILSTSSLCLAQTWPFTPSVPTDGVMEIGKYLDFHDVTNDANDYSVRLFSSGTKLNLWGSFRTTGNVGAGIASPGSRLHVYNGSSGISPHSYADLTIEDDDHGMVIINTPNDKVAYYGFADSDDNFVGGMQYVHADDEIRFRVNNHVSDVIINKEGNVGIGSTTPVGDLQLTGLSQRMIFSTTTTQQESSARIEFWEDHTNISNSANAHFAIQYDGLGDQLRFRGKQSSSILDVDLMTIKRNGAVGIGTTTPSEKLEVNGTIRTQEVKVEASPWPDYVFTPNYKLRSLEETEQFIKKNQHLPEIPSAQEVEAEGLALGEMNALLLKKIEELTLHLIEKDKEVSALAETVAALQKQMDQLTADQ